MCRIQPILDKFPDHDWIVVHEYESLERVKESMDFLRYWIDNGKIKYYFHYASTGPRPMPGRLTAKLNALGISNDRIFDLYVFQKLPEMITKPNLGIELPGDRNLKKAVILRSSKYHRHFLRRNRPFEEWTIIERRLLDQGYTVYLLGKDDTMPVTDDVIDLRNKLSLWAILDFTKDAGLCVSVATFLYVWTQFVCPTIVLSEKGDEAALNKHWKLTDHLNIVSVDDSHYMGNIFKLIDV